MRRARVESGIREDILDERYGKTYERSLDLVI